VKLVDRDLASIQEIRGLIKRAVVAQEKLLTLEQEEVNIITREMALAGKKAARALAELAVEETGLGVVEDKVTKNLIATENLYEYIKNLKTVGVLNTDEAAGVIEMGEPVGVIGALTPVTNPTSTVMYKCIIALKSRNAIVFNPHPTAARCSKAAAEIMARVAVAAGAPEGAIGCVTSPTLESSQEMLRHPDIALILATGGSGMVRAAYSAGKPAIGVGPGNVPAVIDGSADVTKAVADIVLSKTFDNGTICASEQAVIVEEGILSQVVEEFLRHGGYFVNEREIKALEGTMVLPDGRLNPRIVGQPATKIAELAGISVPAETRLLVVPLAGVGKRFPLSMEKLSPVLALYSFRKWENACRLARELVCFGGLGHTAVIHSKDQEHIREFANKIPVGRVLVNTPASHGAVGGTTGLAPALTLGSGTWGKCSSTDNISPLHLLNIKRIAFGKK